MWCDMWKWCNVVWCDRLWYMMLCNVMWCHVMWCSVVWSSCDDALNLYHIQWHQCSSLNMLKGQTGCVVRPGGNGRGAWARLSLLATVIVYVLFGADQWISSLVLEDTCPAHFSVFTIYQSDLHFVLLYIWPVKRFRAQQGQIGGGGVWTWDLLDRSSMP